MVGTMVEQQIRNEARLGHSSLVVRARQQPHACRAVEASGSGGGGRGDRSHEHPRPRRTGPTDPRSGLVVDVVGASHVVRPEFTSGGRVCPALGGLTGRCEAAAKCLEPDLVTNVRAHSVRCPVAADSALSNRSSPSKPNSNTDGRITEENPELQLCVSLIGVLRTCRI